MGNFLTTPHQRPQARYYYTKDMDQDLREMIQSFRKEADLNARLNQQKYERRERRYNDNGVRPNINDSKSNLPRWARCDKKNPAILSLYQMIMA